MLPTDTWGWVFESWVWSLRRQGMDLGRQFCKGMPFRTVPCDITASPSGEARHELSAGVSLGWTRLMPNRREPPLAAYANDLLSYGGYQDQPGASGRFFGDGRHQGGKVVR